MIAGDSHIVIVEDDYHARTWMELIFRRDWRTRVVGTASSPVELSTVMQGLKANQISASLILIDTDIPGDSNWLREVLTRTAEHHPGRAILFTSVLPNIKTASLLNLSTGGCGYILKGEIRNSLAWAASLAAEGKFVITPGVYGLMKSDPRLPDEFLILDGRRSIVPLSELDAARAVMAFIFSMERHELADELGISADFSYGVVSSLYEKIGLNDVLEGNVEPEEFFGSHPALIRHFRSTLENLKKTKSKKARDKESLAFHLLTAPDIEEIRGGSGAKLKRMDHAAARRAMRRTERN